ncbi:MAG: TPM domain-containing protein [candidate division NC10 bacterium]|nr:TPM domain-containing protein [candidate division NC10 bacterium]
MRLSMRCNRRSSPSTRGVFPCLATYLLLSFFLIHGPAFAAVSFPKPEGWVTDRAGLLDPTAKARLEQLLTEVDRKSGVEIAVVTLPTLGGRSVEEVAVELFHAWGISKKGKDEGLLLLVAPKERKLRIEVGYGLEGTIPDGMAGEIIRETITPRFRQGEFAEGIETGVRQIVETIARQKQIELTSLHAPRPRTTVSPLGMDQQRLVSKATIFFLLLLVGLIGIAIANERSLRRQRGRGPFRNRFLGFPGVYPGRGWSGGGFGSGDSGGFGGFGGGSSGGGGASGGW